ncbi:MAG: hypothetical protein ACOYML_12615 [Microthrixaceae bacterium]
MAAAQERSTGDEGLPSVILDEFTHALPRLVHRTRHQVGAARHLVSRLPCLGMLAPPARPAEVPAHESVPVTVVSVLDEPDADEVADSSADTIQAVVPDVAPDAASVAEPVPAESDLPVQDYDALAASQVVPRLATLSVDELDAVRRYERAHRNRQTILNRVAQLLDAGS